jgi:hypothetical protein
VGLAAHCPRCYVGYEVGWGRTYSLTSAKLPGRTCKTVNNIFVISRHNLTYNRNQFVKHDGRIWGILTIKSRLQCSPYFKIPKSPANCFAVAADLCGRVWTQKCSLRSINHNRDNEKVQRLNHTPPLLIIQGCEVAIIDTAPHITKCRKDPRKMIGKVSR